MLVTWNSVAVEVILLLASTRMRQSHRPKAHHAGVTLDLRAA
jgi:hypothetical protein